MGWIRGFVSLDVCVCILASAALLTAHSYTYIHTPLATAQPSMQRCLDILVAARHTPTDLWLLDFLAATEAVLPTADATEAYGMIVGLRALRVRPQRRQWADAASRALCRHLPQLAAPQVCEGRGQDPNQVCG